MRKSIFFIACVAVVLVSGACGSKVNMPPNPSLSLTEALDGSYLLNDTGSNSTVSDDTNSDISVSSSIDIPAAENMGGSSTESLSSQTEDLYRSDLVYKRMDDIHNSKLTDDVVYNEITNVIKDFNEKCESYMNNGTEDIFQYLVPGSTAYNQQTDYKKKHPNLTQYYNSVNVRTTRASSTYYYAWVKEDLTQTENNVTKTVEDNWVYKLYKVGDRWYINDYTKDPLNG